MRGNPAHGQITVHAFADLALGLIGLTKMKSNPAVMIRATPSTGNRPTPAGVTGASFRTANNRKLIHSTFTFIP